MRRRVEAYELFYLSGYVENLVEELDAQFEDDALLTSNLGVIQEEPEWIVTKITQKDRDILWEAMLMLRTLGDERFR